MKAKDENFTRRRQLYLSEKLEAELWELYHARRYPGTFGAFVRSLIIMGKEKLVKSMK